MISQVTRLALLFTMALLAEPSLPQNTPQSGAVTELHFIEDKPDDAFRAAITAGFERAQAERFRYAPAGEHERPIDRIRLSSAWRYSVSLNCRGPCSRMDSSLPERIGRARRVDRECPPPYELELELLDASERAIERFEFSAGGTCFAFDGKFYAVAPSMAVGEAVSDIPFYKVFSFR